MEMNIDIENIYSIADKYGNKFEIGDTIVFAEMTGRSSCTLSEVTIEGFMNKTKAGAKRINPRIVYKAYGFSYGIEDFDKVLVIKRKSGDDV
tara:strand:+ start:370 stop:645 length:276 start_codon:yes stop_codon:yes gene_type:complete